MSCAEEIGHTKWRWSHHAVILQSGTVERVRSTCSFKVRHSTGLISLGLEPLYVEATISYKDQLSLVHTLDLGASDSFRPLPEEL